MVSAGRMVAILAAGVALGAGGMALIVRPGPRDLAAIALMDGYCIPWMRGAPTADPAKLRPVPNTNGLVYEPRSLLTLEMSRTRCTITDQLAPYTDAEHAAVIAAAQDRAGQFVADPERRDLKMAVPVSLAIGSRSKPRQPPVVLILKAEAGPPRPDNDAALQVSFIRKAPAGV